MARHDEQPAQLTSRQLTMSGVALVALLFLAGEGLLQPTTAETEDIDIAEQFRFTDSNNDGFVDRVCHGYRYTKLRNLSF